MPPEISSARPYRGVQAADRVAARRHQLLAAGLDLLGAEPAELVELTVRRVCARAKVAARYFYESFADKDEFVGAVFDQVIGELATTTQAAVEAADREDQTRVGIDNVVRTIAGDARIGRLLFGAHLANAVVVRKRVESSALLALLSGQHAVAVLGMPENNHIRAAAHFVVGGVAQTISAWLNGTVRLSPAELVDYLTTLLNELGSPTLYRGMP